ncbi:unnamed protein product, partial [Symbiodinium pilosum]
MRISKGDGFLQREQVSVEEKRTVGLKQPKRKFMTLEAYKKRFGAPDPSKIKSQKIGGVELQGIDIVNEEDEGVFEYIDQSSNAVSRVTDLSDPDLILSKDQNAVIFAAATKLMAPKEDPFVTLQSSSASPSGPASSVAGAGVTDGANAATGVDVSKDIEMDDDDCDNENPFAELFNRMKTSTAPKAAKAKSAAAPKAAAGAPKSKAANRNKKAESDRGSFAPPVKTPGKGDMTQDDEEASSKFRTLVDDFYMLDAASADDDASFASWAKAKIQNMQDLKNQITNKKKSLKRRSTNKDSELGPILDKYAAELTALMDFVRKLSNGNSEGLQLYNTV